MNIISRYILKAHIGPFLFGFFTVVFLFLMQFVINQLDKLLGKGLDNLVIMQLVAYNIPWMTVLAAPMGVLFSTLMAFGSMSANYEITIIKASGGSLLKMMRPVILFGFLIAVFMFWFNDVVLPESNHQAKILMSDIQKKKPSLAFEPGQFSTHLEGRVILARDVDSLTGTLFSLTIYDNTSNDRLSIINADSGIIKFTPNFDKIVFDLFQGEIQQIPTRSNETEIRTIQFKKYRTLVNASGYDFNRSENGLVSRGDRELSIDAMNEIILSNKTRKISAHYRINNLLNENYDYLIYGINKNDTLKSVSGPLDEKPIKKRNFISKVQKDVTFLSSDIKSSHFNIIDAERNIRKYEVEVWKKYAIPLACFLFVFVGAPLGIRTKGGNFGISAAISLAFYIIYWACLIGGEKLADKGHLNPFLAMFMANFIVGFVGIIITLRVNNENFSIKNLFRKN